MKAEQQVEMFNRAYPVGTKVLLRMDDGGRKETTVRSQAWILGGHTVVAKFEGISGGYLINRVGPLPSEILEAHKRLANKDQG